MKILVTGATGYIGGRLIPLLLEQGHQVRVLVRDGRRISGRSWEEQVEIHEGDLLDPETLDGLGKDVDAAYYLVHSMTRRKDFESCDLKAVRHFIDACSGVGHVIYLGGLMPASGGGQASSHLSSRASVGQELREHLPTTEFRAGPIIGSGSASFEMLRYLTDRLPVMVAPKWILNQVQPIGIRDVLSYLLSGLDKEALGIVEIGADVVTFKAMMEIYANIRGYRRLILPVPVLTPNLSARWVGLVTPITNNLAIPLIEGILHPLVADLEQAHRHFPDIEPAPYETAVRRTLKKISEGLIETRWSGSLQEPTDELVDWQGLIRERIVRSTPVSRPELFRTVLSLGGEKGWLAWEWAWELRGLIDQLAGGPGLRRGRRHPTELYRGESLDFWRVEVLEPGHFLRLRAEMKVPGRAWLQWEVQEEDGKTRFIQTAIFQPRGIFGFLYWYLLYPIHHLIFNDMADAIVADALGKAQAD
jgi:uncharacterized protein YbjT (DUF2867 family)